MLGSVQDQIMWMTTTKMPKHNRLSLLMNLSWWHRNLTKVHYNLTFWGYIIDADTTSPKEANPTGWVAQGAKRRTFGKR